MRKRRIVRFILGLLLLLVLLSACSADESDNFPQGDEYDGNTIDQESLSSEVTQYIKEVMTEDGLPGAAVAVVHGDEIVFAEGFGLRDVANNLPVTRETLFHIGSMNKSFTAMMIATLVDEGLFDWDTPVVEIYPDFALSSEEATRTVTMRHLLSMESGIPAEAEDGFDVDYASGEDLFEYVKSVPLLDLPGNEFSYSNISVSLAGYLGVIATGDDYSDLYSGYEQLLRERVLIPIGMKTAVVRVSDAENNPNYGKSYRVEDGEAVEAEREDFDGDPLAPSGTLKVNVVEMAYYISTQINRGQAPNGKRVVSESNLVEMWEPGLENYAMGWEVREYEGVTVISHEGSYDNYLGVTGFVPELGMGFVILTNSEEAGERLVKETPTFLIDLMMEE